MNDRILIGKKGNHMSKLILALTALLIPAGIGST